MEASAFPSKPSRINPGWAARAWAMAREISALTDWLVDAASHANAAVESVSNQREATASMPARRASPAGKLSTQVAASVGALPAHCRMTSTFASSNSPLRTPGGGKTAARAGPPYPNDTQEAGLRHPHRRTDSRGRTFSPSAFATLRWRSSKLRKVSAFSNSATATCNRSRLRLPKRALWRSANSAAFA